MNSGIRTAVLSTLKWLFFLASALYLVHFSHEVVSNTPLGKPTFKLVLATLIAVIPFAMTALFAAFSWQKILRNLEHPRPLGPIAETLFSTQVGKYLPGNIGHHVGRAVEALRRMDIPLPVTITSILQESGLICLSALTLAAVALFLNPVMANGIAPSALLSPLVPAIGGLLALTLIAITLSSIWRRWKPKPQTPVWRWLYTSVPDWKLTLSTLPSYMTMNILNGIALLAIASNIGGTNTSGLMELTGIYALAWVAGFVIPGPPGGLGIRDASLVMLLSASYPPDAALIIAGSARIATIGADALILLLGWSLPRLTRIAA